MAIKEIIMSGRDRTAEIFWCDICHGTAVYMHDMLTYHVTFVCLFYEIWDREKK